LLLWGQTQWDKCKWRAPSGKTINDIHDHSGAKHLGIKVLRSVKAASQIQRVQNGAQQLQKTALS